MHSHFIKMFFSMGLIVLAMSIGGLVMSITNEKPYLYASASEMEEDTNLGSRIKQFLMSLLTNLVLISHSIPMSIYVAIEVLKWFQERLIL